MKKKIRQHTSLKGWSKLIFLSFVLLCSTISPTGEWTQTNFSEGKAYVSGVASGTKVYYAGGSPCDGPFTSKVEIYDVIEGSWDTSHNLSKARAATAVACGGKVFFAGGTSLLPGYIMESRVDILDTDHYTWSTAELSVPRWTAAVSNDSIVIFAGGILEGGEMMSNAVDMYNVNTDDWTTAELSEPRYVGTAVVVGDLAMFAGGSYGPNVTKRIDIYHFSTGEWTIDSLSVARGNLASTVVGDKAFFAGGMTNNHSTSDIVDIFDASTGMWSTANLSYPRAFSGGAAPNAVTVCGKAYFVNGGKLDPNNSYWISSYNIIDIFDSSDNTWSTTALAYLNHKVNHAVVAVDSFLLIAGGTPCQSTVDIFTSSGPCKTSCSTQNFDYNIFPNPAKENLKINASFKNNTSGSLLLFDVRGQAVYQYKFKDDLLNHQIDLNSFSPGLYIVEIRTNIGKIVEKVMVLE